MSIVIKEEDSAHIAIKIEKSLLSALSKNQIQGKNENILFSLTDADNKIIGGITGSTSYGWLLVKTLWVQDSHNGKGYGTALMKAAENRGRQLGCHAAWLDTSNSNAKSFYDKLGYSVFGMLSNESHQHPQKHTRWFMKKDL